MLIPQDHSEWLQRVFRNSHQMKIFNPEKETNRETKKETKKKTKKYILGGRKVRLVFMDIGGVTEEEVNSIALTELFSEML